MLTGSLHLIPAIECDIANYVEETRGVKLLGKLTVGGGREKALFIRRRWGIRGASVVAATSIDIQVSGWGLQLDIAQASRVRSRG